MMDKKDIAVTAAKLTLKAAVRINRALNRNPTFLAVTKVSDAASSVVGTVIERTSVHGKMFTPKPFGDRYRDSYGRIRRFRKATAEGRAILEMNKVFQEESTSAIERVSPEWMRANGIDATDPKAVSEFKRQTLEVLCGTIELVDQYARKGDIWVADVLGEAPQTLVAVAN